MLDYMQFVFAVFVVLFVSSCSPQDTEREVEDPSNDESGEQAQPDPDTPKATDQEAPDPSTEILEVFESYRIAVTEADGETAVSLVSSDTLELYQKYRDLAVTGDEEALNELSMIDRMQALLIRHRVDYETLSSMDGTSIFAHAVDNEWIGKDGVVRASITDIASVGDRATAHLVIDDQLTEEVYHFKREDDVWKFDLVPTIKRTDQVLQAIAREQGLSENEFIFSMISSLSGMQVDESIWLPLDDL